MLFELRGVIEINLSKDEFVDKFLNFVKSLDGCYYGLVREADDDEDD